MLKVPLNTTPIFTDFNHCLNYYHFYSEDNSNIEGPLPTYSNIKLHRQIRRVGDVVYLINGSVDKDFYREIVRKKTKKIVMSSHGGLVYAGEMILKFVKKNNIEVVVPPGGHCYSACARIFLRSKKRYLGQGAELMLHTPRVEKCVVENLILLKKEKDPVAQYRVFNKKKSELAGSFNKSFRKIVKIYGNGVGELWLASMGKDLFAPQNGNLLGFGNWFITDEVAERVGFVERLVDETHPVFDDISLQYFRKKRSRYYSKRSLVWKPREQD